MISTEVLILLCGVLFILKYVVFDTIEDKKTYKLFESRDGIALKAFNGELDQDSEEYQYVIDTINFEIFYTKNDYDFFIILNNLLKRPYQKRKYMAGLLKKVKRNKDLCDAFTIGYHAFIKQLNLRLFIFQLLIIKPIYFVLHLISFILSALIGICDFAGSVKDLVNKFKNEIVFCKRYIKSDPYRL